MAFYLIGQYNLLPRRLGGHPVYKQAETVGKENYFLFRNSSKWQFSHVLGSSDGRYPRSDQNTGLPPKEWKSGDGNTVLNILIPAELKVCKSVVIEANGKLADKVSKCLGTFHLLEGVWSCGKPVYKGPNDHVLMVTGKRWGVKPKLESWGEVVLEAKEVSMGPGGAWGIRTDKSTWEECDVAIIEEKTE